MPIVSGEMSTFYLWGKIKRGKRTSWDYFRKHDAKYRKQAIYPVEQRGVSSGRQCGLVSLISIHYQCFASLNQSVLVQNEKTHI